MYNSYLSPYLTEHQRMILSHEEVATFSPFEIHLDSLFNYDNHSDQHQTGSVFFITSPDSTGNLYVTVNGVFTLLQLGSNNEASWLYTQSYEPYWNLTFDLNLLHKQFFLVGFINKDSDILSQQWEELL